MEEHGCWIIPQNQHAYTPPPPPLLARKKLTFWIGADFWLIYIFMSIRKGFLEMIKFCSQRVFEMYEMWRSLWILKCIFVPGQRHFLAKIWERGCAPHAAELAVGVVAGNPVLPRPLQVQRNQVHPVPVPVEQVVGDVLREPGVKLLHPVPGQALSNTVRHNNLAIQSFFNTQK